MTDILKQAVINAVDRDKFIQHSKEITQMSEDADKGICSNISIESELSLYNVQFVIEKHGKIVNKFVYALDEQDAKEIVFKCYRNFEFDKSNVYCQKVNIKRGMIFNA